MRTAAFVLAALAVLFVGSTASADWEYVPSVQVVAPGVTVQYGYYGPGVVVGPRIIAPAPVVVPRPVLAPVPVVPRPVVVPYRPWRRPWIYY